MRRVSQTEKGMLARQAIAAWIVLFVNVLLFSIVGALLYSFIGNRQIVWVVVLTLAICSSVFVFLQLLNRIERGNLVEKISGDLGGDGVPSIRTEISSMGQEIRSQVKQALELIRNGQVDEGLELVYRVERDSLPFLQKLPAEVRYLIPFALGRAHLQRSELALAQSELTLAFQIAQSDELAIAQVGNLLGVAFYLQEQPQLALKYHEQCLRIVRAGIVSDSSLKQSIYRNLGNDYWALNKRLRAISIYHEALEMLGDTDKPERRAGIYWGLCVAYKSLGNVQRALSYGQQALQVYEALGNRVGAAGISTNLSEILADIGKYEDAEARLRRVHSYLEDAAEYELKSSIYEDLADLALRQKRLDQAAKFSKLSVQLSSANLQSNRQSASGGAIRAHARALHVTARVEEALGNKEVADKLFQEALRQIYLTEFKETAFEIEFSYAEVLQMRGDTSRATQHYDNAEALEDDQPEVMARV